MRPQPGIRNSLLLATLLGFTGMSLPRQSSANPINDEPVKEPNKEPLGFRSDHWLSHPRAKHCANPNCGSPVGHKLTKSQRREIRTFNAKMADKPPGGGRDNG